jgi:hypothetical protein
MSYTLTKKIAVKFSYKCDLLPGFHPGNKSPNFSLSLISPMIKRLPNMTAAPISDRLDDPFSSLPINVATAGRLARSLTCLTTCWGSFESPPLPARSTACSRLSLPILTTASTLLTGQQRLTTLSLILTYFNSRSTEEEA